MSRASNGRERMAPMLALHWTGVAVLAVVVLGLAIRLGMDWAATSQGSSGALASGEMQLKALELQTAPLRGLDKRVEESRGQIRSFYQKRVPASYSAIATRIGELQVKSGVHMSRVIYTQGPAGPDLTEISMDAGIAGYYPQIMHFVNSLERDQTFFVIRAMSLTGQQGGMVSLRLRVSTWLRPADVPEGMPATPALSQPDASSTGPAKEGE